MIPELNKKHFCCPFCGVLAKQDWSNCDILNSHAHNTLYGFFLEYREGFTGVEAERIKIFVKNYRGNVPNIMLEMVPSTLSLSRCQSCYKSSLWISNKIVYPRQTLVDPPNPDIDERIREIYMEAASIVSDSPKGAGALLRLALQELLIQLGEEGKNINHDIGQLVQKGLSPKIQQALDVVRVVGNNAVHPGIISLDDDKQLVNRMFKIINVIADEMITRPKEIDDLYNNILPDAVKDAVNKRDTPKQ